MSYVTMNISKETKDLLKAKQAEMNAAIGATDKGDPSWISLHDVVRHLLGLDKTELKRTALRQPDTMRRVEFSQTVLPAIRARGTVYGTKQ